MKILKIECHQQLAEAENLILRNLGNWVTSIGFDDVPSPEINNGLTYIRPGFDERSGLISLSKNYLKDFDLIISCYYPFNLIHILKNYDGPVILRTINSIHDRLENIYEKAYEIRPFTTVRMSEKELQLNKIPCETIIRESIDENKFKGWNGTKENVLTVCKNAYGRWDWDFDIYERITDNFPKTLLGEGNPVRNDIISGCDESTLIKEMQNSKVNYVQGRINGCATYGFAESLVMGMPTICLGRKWLGEFWMAPEYIKNGVNGYFSDNIEEIRHIIKKLLESPLDKFPELSYNARVTGEKLFGLSGNTKLWEQILSNLKV